MHDVTRLGKRLASPEMLEEDSLFIQIGEVVMGFFRNSSLKETNHSCQTMYRQDRRQISLFDAHTSCVFFHALECIVRIPTLKHLVPQLHNAVTVNFIQHSISFTFPNMLKSYFKIYFVTEFSNVLIEFQTNQTA